MVWSWFLMDIPWLKWIGLVDTDWRTCVRIGSMGWCDFRQWTILIFYPSLDLINLVLLIILIEIKVAKKVGVV